MGKVSGWVGESRARLRLDSPSRLSNWAFHSASTLQIFSVPIDRLPLEIGHQFAGADIIYLTR